MWDIKSYGKETTEPKETEKWSLINIPLKENGGWGKRRWGTGTMVEGIVMACMKLCHYQY